MKRFALLILSFVISSELISQVPGNDGFFGTNASYSDSNNELIGISINREIGDVTIIINTTYGNDCDLIIHNDDGKVVFSRPFNFNEKRSFTLHAEMIARGNYTITVIDGQKEYNKKLLIE